MPDSTINDPSVLNSPGGTKPGAGFDNTSFSPAEPPPRRSYSEWDPRAAPGTYFLLAVNILVFVYMVASGVSLTSRPSNILVFCTSPPICGVSGTSACWESHCSALWG